MRIPFFHVDAFASEVFKGNPAGVCLLREWLPDAVMQAVAAENNLPETAFVLRGKDRIELRWFTPTVEVDLCGHATLAAAHVLFAHMGGLAHAGGPSAAPIARIEFHSKSGLLAVERDGELLVLDFPSRPPLTCAAPEALIRGLGRAALEVLGSRDYLCVYEREEDVASLRPDMPLLAGLDRFGVIVTAPGSGAVDFVSRFFAPGDGIPEDPVTGSSHCTLIPYWATRLGRAKLSARQISARGGELACELAGDRVRIGGRAVTYLRGEIEV
jgi:predicted PhzF superfamily epimerase YddE/YHI9